MNLANKLTMFRVILIPVFLIVLYADFDYCRYVALAIFAVASFTDYLDGHIARSRGLVTDFGKFMDPLADKVLVMTAMLMFVSWGQMPAWVLAVVLARELAVSGLRMLAAADGKVLTAFTANTTGGGYGYHVIIDHGTDAKGQRITTLYAHMSEVFVKAGQTVKGGETVLGKAGDTGRVSGPHLHFEVRVNNVCVDPIGKRYVKP